MHSGSHPHSSVRSCKTEESLKRLLLPCCCALQQWLIYGFINVFLGSINCSAESNPVISCQIYRLWTPRARATEPVRDPNLRPVYRRAPCVLPSRERQKRPTDAVEKRKHAQNKTHLYMLIQGPAPMLRIGKYTSVSLVCIRFNTPSVEWRHCEVLDEGDAKCYMMKATQKKTKIVNSNT